MPSQISDIQYGQAILESVQNGSYPESEEVVASELPPSAIASVEKLIEHACEDVKRIIRKISRESALDIDGWLSQAKQLQGDIEDSQRFSQDIVNRARHGEQLQSHANDATEQLGLLNGEVIFNDTLAQILEKIRYVQQALGVTEEAIRNDKFEEAVDLLREAEDTLAAVRECQNTRVAGLLQLNISNVRQVLEERLSECWNSAFCIDISSSAIFIKQHIQCSSPLDFNIVVDALSKMNLLQGYIKTLYEQLDTIILLPRLKKQAGGALGSMQIEDNRIMIHGKLMDLSIQSLFRDMNLLVEFLHTQLPSSVSSPLAKQLMPHLISLLISDWLSLEVPTDINEISKLESVLAALAQFADVLESYGWRGNDRLMEWSNRIPDVWLNKRKEISLDKIRILLARGLGKSERVERVETQMLSREDDVFKAKNGDDEWNAGWSDEEGGDAGKVPKPPDAKVRQEADRGGDEEDEDVSAWGLDDENTDGIPKEKPTVSTILNDEADAWGWGDENEDIEEPQPVEDSHRAVTANINGRGEVTSYTTREVKLRETYNITALPKAILEIITHLVSDAETLRSPGYINSPIVSAASGLLSLPGLVLSMYRASAPIYYAMNPSGNMFLYNDSLWLAESLRQFTGAQSRRAGQINAGAAEIEISALESFAKRTYGKEMESQRTIIGDLLDGAQGFINCTESPFAQECDIAISSTVDRLREVHKQWKEVLCHSALLQSLGSLLSTVVNKIIVDVEDMSDISEPESQRLTAFCNRVATLEDLFTSQNPPNDAPDTQAVPLTAVYTPNWLKFQYLANILESSLVDIKYLWAEGELRLEFEAEELVDLIEALFADSEHRRKAIGEIRRASVGQ